MKSFVFILVAILVLSLGDPNAPAHANALVVPGELPPFRYDWCNNYDRKQAWDTRGAQPGHPKVTGFNMVWNPTEVCAAGQDWVRRGGAYGLADFRSSVHANTSLTVKPAAVSVVSLIGYAVKFYKFIGDLQKKNCYTQPTRWIRDRSTPCTPVGVGGLDSIRTVVPSGMLNYYNLRSEQGGIRLEMKNVSSDNVLQINCIDMEGKEHQALAPSILIRTNSLLSCVIMGAVVVTPRTQWLQAYIGIQRRQMICETRPCNNLRNLWKLPFFTLAFAPARHRTDLQLACSENQNNGAWSGSVEWACG
ncbi:hypothetical protein NESM_000737400 [Novymonas esmeraldas]|uniref:Uncharacterized protein n=1 Tax=Novymonas esmeraldas TaxID=1808958 RepID=A0AAW0EXJ4_9TRYP